MSNEHLDRVENVPEDGGGERHWNCIGTMPAFRLEQGLRVVSVSSAEQAGRLDRSLWHLTPNERAGLEAFVDRLRCRYGDDLLRVVLFGSKARGDFDDESDIDLLVVVLILETLEGT